MLEISFWIVKNILTNNVKMGWTASKFVPCLLSEKQKEDRVNVCQELQEGLERNSETKEWSSYNKQGGRTKQFTQMWIACSVFSSMFVESYIINFFHKDQLTHHYHHYYYTDTLQRLHKNMWQRDTEKWNMRNRFLHRDNTPAHCFVCAQIFGYKQNDCHSRPSLLITSGTMRLLSFPTTQDGIKGKEI